MHRCHRIASLALGLLVSTGAAALDVNVVGLFPSKAVVQIEGGALRTLSVGQKTRDDVTLLSVERDGATFDIQGRRVAFALGSARTPASPAAAASNVAVLASDRRGDLAADGEAIGKPVRFPIDAGATYITLPAREASRLGLAYQGGQKIVMEAANGDVNAHRLKLDTVRVGDVVVHNVDAVITEGSGLSMNLLGMSFLNRVDMRHEGAVLTLTKR